MRFLCLHGYAQNGEFFRSRLGALRKAVKGATFHFIDAPYPASAPWLAGELEDDSRGAPLGWWEFEGDTSRPSTSAKYYGLEEAMEKVRKTIEEEGPFDGLLGFSQGASLVAMLCLLPPAPPPVRFVVLFAAFPPRDMQFFQPFESGYVDIPSLHIMGESDKLVPMEASTMVAARFNGARTVIHPGGHGVPSSAPIRAALKEFVANPVASLVAPVKEAVAPNRPAVQECDSQLPKQWFQWSTIRSSQ